LDKAQRCLLVPAGHLLAGFDAQVETVAERHETRVHQADRLVQPALKNLRGLINAVASMPKKRVGIGVAGQETGQIAASIEPQVEGGQRLNGAGEESRGAPFLKIGFCSAEQVGANSLPPISRADTQSAGHSGGGADAGKVWQGTEAGMDKAA